MKMRQWLTIGLSTTVLLACGGGQEDSSMAKINSGGTGSYANGPITDFGSIVVNGIHFDQTLATVTSAEEPGRQLTPGDLQLGMTVDLEGLSKPSGELGAVNIRVSSALLGPVDSIDAVANTVTVMGQTVQVLSTTELGAELGADQTPQGWKTQLLKDDLVEVFGFHDPMTNVYVATRLEKPNRPITHYVVKGVITDFIPSAGTCMIGGQYLGYSKDVLPPGLADGQVARALIDANQPKALGAWKATSMEKIQPILTDSESATVEGLVTDSSGPTQPKQFSVNGIKVDASSIVCPACATLQLGERVLVRGALAHSVILATEVTLGSPD